MRNKFDTNFKIKKISDDGKFSGHGSVFHVVDGARDVIVPGAFKKSLDDWKKKDRLPGMFWQHDTSKPIGKYLTMEEDEVGLFVEGQLLKDDVQQAAEAYALMKAEAISGLSIGYNTLLEEWDRDARINTLKEIDLWEVSLVSFPCNDEARVETVKNLETERDIEKYLRENGFSRTEAIGIIAKARKIYGQRESDNQNVKTTINNLINQLKK
jgi:HK97 family phage prohead protease